MKTEAASLKWSELDSALISTLQIPDKRFSRLRMHIPFPAVPLKNTQCPFPSIHQSITSGMQEAGPKLWGPRLSREGDSLEKEKTVGLFSPHFSQFSGRMYLCFDMAEGYLRL